MGERGVSSILVIAIVIVIAVAAIGGYYLVTRGGQGGTKVVYKTYTNENYSFKFDYPENWGFNPEDFALIRPPMVAYFGAGPLVAYSGAGGITVTTRELSLSVFDKAGYENRYAVSLDNLTSYLASLENQFENNNENFVVRSGPTVVAIDNHNGVRLSAVQSTSIAVRIQFETVVKDNYFYAFEIVAPEENYSIDKPMFEHLIDSFSLLA